jgi:ABC-type antimicrobial peptide transport system permease subunit
MSLRAAIILVLIGITLGLALGLALASGAVVAAPSPTALMECRGPRL